MIPVQLKLRNFMAYQEATLPFQGIHLAALTGDNGAGKSSLLDAMTWAVWGKARVSRADDLIRLGQSEMEVEFTFSLNENVYRIVRKRDAAKRGRSNLSFQVEDAGGWRTLTENSLRATEKKINQLLRLDYETFINSAFLLQGRADEFTTRTPSERKKILSDVLGLELYEQYSDRAKQRANRKQTEVAVVEAEIKRIEGELAREPEYRNQLVTAEKDVAALAAALEAAEHEMESLRDQHRAINDKQRQLDDLRDRLSGAESDLADLAQAIAAAQKNIERYQTILAKRDKIEAGLAQLAQAKADVKDWDNRLQESARLSNRKHELDKAVQLAHSKIEADLREITATINLVQPKVAAKDSLVAQLKKTQTELDALKQLESEQTLQRDALAALGQENARLTEQNKQFKLEMDDIKENLTRLEEAGSSCPVCKRPLDETHRQEVSTQFRTEGKTKGDLYRTNRTRLAEIKSEQKSLKQAIAQAEKQLRQLARAQGKVARLEQSVQEAEEAVDKLATAQAGQAALQKRLDNRDFATDVLTDLVEVETELELLGYKKSAHQQARQAVDTLTHFEDDGRNLAEAEKRIKEEEQRLEREKTRHARLLGQTAADRQKIVELEQDTAGFLDLVRRLNEAGAAVDTHQREVRYARDRVARANQMLDHIAYQAKERGKQEDKLQQIKESLGIYRELQTAFGKKGVQALLIESAIPEIEDEANLLLNRMTDGRMSLRFETQREAKSSGSTIETLNIRIADEAGTRDYELYSGGEAFRINFAIRIAISKVLARRAGARLQTLMIDEGFGTQDTQGRERLVEVINTVQDDFEKLIVITHIDELKDAFPVRIDVWKTPEGSQVAIR